MRWTRILVGLGLLGQAMVVARIAALDVVTAFPLLAVAAASAVVLAHAPLPAAWMIGWGGLGMTLGWWADLGFRSAAEVAQHGGIEAIWCRAPALVSAHTVPGWGHLVSWMNAGMLVFGISGAARWMRPASLLRCTIGMLVGMIAGSQFAAAVAARWDPAAAVIVDYAAMGAGMVAGMIAVERPSWRRVQIPRNAAIATRAQPATVTRNPSAPA